MVCNSSATLRLFMARIVGVSSTDTDAVRAGCGTWLPVTSTSSIVGSSTAAATGGARASTMAATSGEWPLNISTSQRWFQARTANQ